MSTTIEDQFKGWMSDWRKRFEEMQVQASLGKMDAVDAFEKQKDTMRKSIVEWKEKMDAAGDKGEAYAQELRAKLEQLQVQLNLGKAEGKELFEEQREKIEAALNEVKATGKQKYNESFDKMMELFDHNSNAFKTGLEVLQLQFSLAKMDAKDDVEEAKKQVKEKLEQLNASFKEAQTLGMQNLENWTKEMQQGYDKMKTWTEEWMKKMKP